MHYYYCYYSYCYNNNNIIIVLLLLLLLLLVSLLLLLLLFFLLLLVMIYAARKLREVGVVRLSKLLRLRGLTLGFSKTLAVSCLWAPGCRFSLESTTLWLIFGAAHVQHLSAWNGIRMGPELRGLQNAVVEYKRNTSLFSCPFGWTERSSRCHRGQPTPKQKKVACSFLGACASTVDPLLEDLPLRHNVDFQSVRRP